MNRRLPDGASSRYNKWSHMKMEQNAIRVRGLNGELGLGTAANGMTVKSHQEIDAMYEAGQITGLALQVLAQVIAPGMTTRELDEIAEREIRLAGAIPAFKGYRGFPASLCISVNEEIVHGIPGSRVIREGDVVGLDLGAIYDGLYGDSARTVPVGDVSREILNQIEAGRSALLAGVGAVRAGARIGDVSNAVEREILDRGDYGIVREYVGHGIGRRLHEEPQVPNYGSAGRGPVLKPGMAIAIEPMINFGGDRTKVLDDDWTVVTADGTVSVHYEHTVIVTDGDPIVTTRVE